MFYASVAWPGRWPMISYFMGKKQGKVVARPGAPGAVPAAAKNAVRGSFFICRQISG